MVLVPCWTEYPIDPRDAPAHQLPHVAIRGVLSTVVVATPFPHCRRSCSPESGSCVKSEVRTFDTPDTTSVLRSMTRKPFKLLLSTGTSVPESWIVRLPSVVVITKCDRSRVEFVTFFTSIHSSSGKVLVPAHATSLMISGCVVTYTVFSVDVAAVPFDLCATTANVVVADALMLLVAEIEVVVASTTSFFTTP